jgi:hypothetical protein
LVGLSFEDFFEKKPFLRRFQRGSREVPKKRPHKKG